MEVGKPDRGDTTVLSWAKSLGRLLSGGGVIIWSGVVLPSSPCGCWMMLLNSILSSSFSQSSLAHRSYVSSYKSGLIRERSLCRNLNAWGAFSS